MRGRNWEIDIAWNVSFERVDILRVGADVMSPLHAAVENMY